MIKSANDAMLPLYQIAQGTYVTSPYATTTRQFVIDSMLTPQLKQFKLDSLLLPPSK